jgi:dienelactone hydrolase
MSNEPLTAQPVVASDWITPDKLVCVKRLGRLGDGQFAPDPVDAARIAGTFAPPQAGDQVALSGGKKAKWEAVAPGKDNTVPQSAITGGYAFWSVTEADGGVAILEASGHSMVFVNGEPRTGDIYSDGFVRLPVLLRKGENGFLFKAGRGDLHVRLRRAPMPVSIDTTDATLPDLHAGSRSDTWGAVVVINASEKAQTGLSIVSQLPGGQPVVTPAPRIEPLSIRKVGFRIAGPAPPNGAQNARLMVAVKGAGATPRATVDLRVRKAGQTFKQTFVSRMDGSVQYFAVNPAQPGPESGCRPALVLSLHGASVQAIGQADAYGPKSWATLVAPTNRRPFGYDWEDWGRIDAMEVLDIAQRTMGLDNSRTYLVGHSMGGHGTWQLGALYPDRFAAIAPSAGWISAYTYTGAKVTNKSTPVEDILRRSGAAMDTLALAQNYAREGVYILHGTDDDNVPVTEARRMRDVLSGFHKDFLFHEEPGQGHWWDISDEPGADCVDWPPMWDFLAKHTLPPIESVRQVDFVTVNPGVSAHCQWLTVEGQTREGIPSEVHFHCDPQMRRYKGTTINVSSLAIELRALMPGKGVSVEIDGTKLNLPDVEGRATIHLYRAGDGWGVGPATSPDHKNPARYGPFRAAFDNRFQMVYGTAGTPEENAWAFAKARYDAECWWYRGNGSVDVIPDTAFDPTREPDRGVILYGNATTNAAWRPLLGGSPVQVRPGGVHMGDKEVMGDGLACLFLQPRPGSAVACVAAVSATGIRGMRLADTLGYLQPMTGYPDVLLLSAGAIQEGRANVVAAGFLGSDWSARNGEIEWQEAAK